MGKVQAQGTKRRLRLALDPVQYYDDLTNSTNSSNSAAGVYEAINLLVRRDPRENNFAAVLRALQDMGCSSSGSAGQSGGSAADERLLPRWLRPYILGQPLPSSAQAAVTAASDR